MTVLRDYASTVSQPTLPFGVRDDGFGLNGTVHFDEVIAPDGTLRPAWRAMAQTALSVTPDELHRVEGEITRLLADDGVTYTLPDGTARPWHLDPVPLVIDAATWARLDVGLAQRAELLNALLVDLYGPQTLLKSGVVPSAVIFGHSGFARPVARPSAVDKQPLLISGTDLGRDASGEWCVITDRVQAPSGLGFAMENRRVISQVLPDLFQEGALHHMEPYFAALRAALVGSAHEGVSDPQVVVMSPGTHSETAFDQASLANALGFPLVQGSDLVVRDGWVWMKPARWPSAKPTQRIDVIVRRVDADWCDPLELRSNSQLGVAGLSEAVRRGRVRLVNGLGSGVLENPALLPYMAAACEHLLGETLRLPQATAWWCGDPDARATVVSRLADGDPGLLVRTIDQPRATVADLSSAELIARIAAAPHRYVGQDVLPLSQAPVWTRSGRVAAQPLMFRAFTLRYGSAYRPLIGGLATVREDELVAPVTKDVWVMKASDTDPDQGLIDIDPGSIGRTVPVLAPRALEDLFWAGRYAERAEDLLRLLLTTDRHIDQSRGARSASSDGPGVLMGALQRLAGTRSSDPEEEFRSLLLDRTRTGGAAHSFAALRDALEGVRDQMSGDTWRVFSGIERASKALRSSSRSHRTAESGGRMLTCILSLGGITASMMRDSGWHMIEAGRYLERSIQLCHLLSATVTQRRGAGAERQVLDALLTAAESVVTYRRRYRGSLRIADVLDLLLLAPDNPRSLAFALARLDEHLAALPVSTGSTRPERLVDHLAASLEELDIVELSTPSDIVRESLQAFLDDVVSQLEQLSEAVSQQHFEAGPPPVALSSLSIVEEWGASA